ncbi:MAG: PEP-CTERM sorting domain-containing protein [Phycisphaeraceae bacterium]
MSDTRKCFHHGRRAYVGGIAVVAGMGLMLGLAPTVAADILKDHTVNFSAADPALADADGVHQWGFTEIRSVVIFDDPTGTTFTEYIVGRYDTFSGAPPFSDPVTVPGYRADHEITLVMAVEGTSTPFVPGVGSEFVFDSILFGELWHDSDAAYTPSTYSNLASFRDGTMVQELVDPSGAFALGGGTVSAVDTLEEFSGHFTLQSEVLDQLPGGFQSAFRDFGDNAVTPDPLLGIASGNFTRILEGEAAVISDFQAFFGFSYDPGLQEVFVLQSGGQYRMAIPEPGALLLVAVGAGLMLYRRPRHA